VNYCVEQKINRCWKACFGIETTIKLEKNVFRFVMLVLFSWQPLLVSYSSCNYPYLPNCDNYAFLNYESLPFIYIYIYIYIYIRHSFVFYKEHMSSHYTLSHL
jgi:hypothetical protein